MDEVKGNQGGAIPGLNLSTVTGLNLAEYKGMTDNSPINIMYCDLNFTITYINQTSKDTLQKIEKFLPIRVNAIVGSSIDVFHKVPAHQRRILANDKNCLTVRLFR